MNIGERIKSRRLELGLSVDDVAEALNKNRATVYRYESNAIENLPITALEPLAHVLRTTPPYLMGWTDDPYDWDRDPLNRAATIPLSYIEGCNGDVQQAWKVMKTAELEALNELSTKSEDSDPELYRIERARKRMSEKDKEKMMNILKASFDEYFSDDFENDDSD